MRTLISTASVAFIAGALISFAWTTSHHSETIGKLRNTVDTQITTIRGLNGDVKALRDAIADNNKRIADERKAFEEARKKTEASLVELEKTNKARWARIKELEKLAIPPVDISGMTQEQIVVEITDCRQAVEINNGF
jgi:septal ring factor EnvC (AmiA/AmiB activator)